MKINKRLLLVSFSSFGLTVMNLPAEVQITSFNRYLLSWANENDNDTGTGFDFENSDIEDTDIIPFSNASLSAADGFASASTTVDLTGSTGFPAALNTTVTGFNLQLEGGVSASTAAGTAESYAEASINIDFTVEVVSGMYDFNFSKVGDGDLFSYLVNNTLATNETQTLTLGVGSHSVSILNDVTVRTDDLTPGGGQQSYLQTYNLEVVESIPEPSSTALVGIGGLVLLAHRKRNSSVI